MGASQFPNHTHDGKFGIVTKLMGNGKESQLINQSYMSMLAASQVQIDQKKIKHKSHALLERKKLRPGSKYERLKKINPKKAKNQHSTTLEEVYQRNCFFKKLVLSNKSPADRINVDEHIDHEKSLYQFDSTPQA